MCSNILYWGSIPFLLKPNYYDIARCLLKKEHSRAHVSHHNSLDKPLHLTTIVSHAPIK